MATNRQDGYTAIQDWTHPRRDSCGRVLQHIVIVEQALGMFLPNSAVVHHVDDVKSNNFEF